MKYTIDATNKKLGRVAQEAATYLMGKNSVHFARNIVPEVKVVVSNAAMLDVSEKKKGDKYYLTYSGYPGGQKKETLGDLADRKGMNEAVKRAVSRMLPKNKLRDKMLLNLEVTN